MGKAFWIILVGVVITLLAVFAIFREPEEPLPAVDNPHEITDQDHVDGPEEAAVTLVEYSDFACPACGAAEPLIAQLKTDYAEDLRFVYRHFPVTGPAGREAALASVAAEAQGSFWEMHDLLFERQQEWSQNPRVKEVLEGYAEELGLDVEQFQNDVTAAASRVDRDRAIAEELGVTATPTFFVNNEQIENPATYEEFSAIIEAAIAEANDTAETPEAADSAE